MKYLLISVLFISLVILAGLFALGRYSQSLALKPSVDLRLARCPEAANCVCSEYPQDQTHYVESIDISELNQVNDLNRVVPIVTGMGGEIVLQQEHYLAATFTSKLFGFVDDFELRLDQDTQQIQMRSASRVGRSDLGANKLRTDEFKQKFQASL